jgi:hypothetical protein
LGGITGLTGSRARRDCREPHQNPPGVCPHDEFADVEARHDGLPGSRVVGQDEPEGLAGQHRFVDGGDLVRERVHVRGVDCHHRVEQEREVDSLRLAGQLERGRVAVEGPGPRDRRRGNRRLVVLAEEPLLECPVGQLVDDLDGPVRDDVDGDDRANEVWFEADGREAGLQFGELSRRGSCDCDCSRRPVPSCPQCNLPCSSAPLLRPLSG